MIITKEVDIKINIKNIQHFKELGYLDLKINGSIKIPIEHLMRGSKTEVLVSCDICKKSKVISYKLYNYCISKHNFYTCVGKCTNIKREKTSINLCGKKHWMQYDENFLKYKNSLIEKTGYDNPFKSEKSKLKFRQTLLERYGVENLSHSQELYLKQQISGFSMKKHDKTGLFYRGTYELDFLNFSFEKNLNIEQGKRFEYFHNGKKRYYFSDFFYAEKNLVIEIKSEYYYKKYLDVNLLKENSVISKGYNYLLIINKDYVNFEKFISTR